MFLPIFGRRDALLAAYVPFLLVRRLGRAFVGLRASEPLGRTRAVLSHSPCGTHVARAFELLPRVFSWGIGFEMRGAVLSARLRKSI